MGHGYFAVAGWGVVFTLGEFMTFVHAKLKSTGVWPDCDYPTNREFANAFYGMLSLLDPGLEKLIILHYEQQQLDEIQEVFATALDASVMDVRGACGESQPIPSGAEMSQAYDRLVAVCDGAGKAGLFLFGYEGA